MPSKRYLWRVYCPTHSQFETTVSITEPTVCPTDGVSPVDPAFTAIIDPIYEEIVSEGYVIIDSQLADNQALKIQASNTNGGIIMNSGIGGINVTTTNAISLNSAAASNFTTSSGNLILKSTIGLVNIDGGSGINIGNDSTTTPIHIGTSSYSKNISIGNNTGTTNVSLSSGSGQIIINSADTTANAIQMYSSGGVSVSASGLINIATSSSAGGAITLDASFGGGGIVLSSGSQGIAISSNGGIIGIGHWSGGDIYIGTATVARTITMGNTTSTSAIVLTSGSGGIAIGNDTSSGDIELGNINSAKTILLGNGHTDSRIFFRYGSAGIVRHQESTVSLSNSDATLIMANILKGILYMTPTVNRTLTLPTAANAVSGISGVIVGDSVDFTIINQSTQANGASIIISMGTGGTMIGNSTITSYSNILATYFNSGSGNFRMVFTNVSSGTESYTIYRIS